MTLRAKSTPPSHFDRLHAQVQSARSVREMWLVYARARFAPHGIDITDPAVQEVTEASFYAGVAAMFELMTRVAPDDVSEDRGVDMLTRLQDELAAYSQRTRGVPPD